MLQSIAAWILQTYAGEYIENLNADQLTIGYGGIELENLTLKPSAFRKLGLPLKLISGSIGKLNLVIPYANPSTEPWIIKIEDLSLVVEIDTSVQYDYKFEEELAKQGKLDKLELEWKANKQKGGKGSWWSRSWFPSLYSSISSKIADNLQTDIKNVKIQFINQDLSLTVFVESLSAQTSNDQWVKTTEGSGNKMKYKLLLLEGLSIYSNQAENELNLKYILGPVFAEGHIIRNASKVSLSTKDGPRFYIEMLLEDVKLSLTNVQYQFLANIVGDLNLYFKSIEHSSSRPAVSVRKDPKLWWQFAIKSVLEPIKENNRRRTKDFLVKRVLDINLYAVLYSKHISDNVLSSTEKDSLKDIEGKMNYEEIAILRKILYGKHTELLTPPKNVDENVAATDSNASWSGWIMSFNPLWQQQDQQAIEDAKLTKEEEKFLDELSELSVEGDTLFNRDSVFAKIAFTLNHGCIALSNEAEGKQVLNINFNGVNISSNVYSKSRSWEWMMALQSFLVAAPNSADHLFPYLMNPQNHNENKSNNNENPFLYIKFYQKQLNRNSAYNISINMQPSNVVYNFSVVTDVKEFFYLPEKSKYKLNISVTESMTHRFQTAVNSQIQELKLATKAEFDNIIAGTGNHFAEEGNEWSVYLDIAAPSIIMPVQIYGTDMHSDQPKKMVILNLGRLMFYNDHAKHGKTVTDNKDGCDDDDDDSDEFLTPSSTPPSIEDQMQTVEYIDPKLDISEIMEKFYDSYTLELSMVQVLVSNVSKDWFLQQPKGFGPDHIIEEFSVTFSFKRRTIFTTDPALPALTLSTVLPQLCVHIDQTKMEVLYQNINMIKASFAAKNGSQSEPALPIISQDNPNENSQTSEMFHISYMDLLVESKLLLAKFNIEKLSLGLHSRGRCFAELQIEGVECEYVKRPQDTSVSFILSSLMLIDAMQTYGSEYELLVTSKCIEEQQQNDVLIHICYQMINADCPSLGNSEKNPVQILSVDFNSLLINGNLETIVELHNVVNQILNQQKKSLKTISHTNKDILDNEVEKEGINEDHIKISAYFKQIDLLMFYSKKDGNSYVPQKVSKISFGELQLNSTMGRDDNSSSGGIGNIIVIDLSPRALPHKQIFSVGCQNLELDQEEKKAFNFKHSTKKDKDTDLKNDFLDIEMASAYYTHNPHFITQVALCVGDFKQYAYNLAKSLQNTASDLAKSMVSTKRQLNDTFNQSHNVDFFIDDITHTDEKMVKSKFLFSIIVETPVIYLPSDLSNLELIVCNLGKITAHNSSNNDYNVAGENPLIDKLIVEVQKINLAVLKLSQANVQDIISKNVPLQSCITHKDSNLIVIIHNTDLYLQADKISTLNHSTNFLKTSFKLEGKVNTALKLFLSVPTYKQILSTIQFACDIKGESWKPSEPTTSDVKSQVTEVTEDGDDDPDITFMFQMPSLKLELHGELQGKSHGFVIIECEMFHLRYVHETRHLTLSLQDFFIEDLLCKSSDKFRYLICSGEKKEINNYLFRTSTSCPEYSGTSNVVLLSKSLPDISAGFSPGSFPSSSDYDLLRPKEGHLSNNGPLLSLQAMFSNNKDSMHEDHVDKKFEIDLNSVDVVINLQTWVILFDFIGIGVQNPPNTPVKVAESSVHNENDSAIATKKFEVIKYAIDIKTVMFYLNKEDYPLAKVVVDNLNLNAILSNDNQDISGNIGIIELHDLSPYNGFFMKRLITLGDSAIKFEFYRYGKPDPDLEREFDMRLCLCMSSVQYIHTQRFLIECISFCQHFVFLQEVLGRMRAASAGDEVMAYVNRCPRVILKINTDAPILILPRRSNSRDVLVANLGKLDIQNKFLYASNPDTEAFSFIASRSRCNMSTEASSGHTNKMDDRLLDCIQIKLSDMQVYMAAKVEDESYHYLDMFVKQGSEIMCEPCTLELKVERNLEWAFGRQVPDMSISGRLSSIALFIDLAQYGQIMDMLAENLGEPLDAFIAPSSVLVDPLVFSSPVQQLWTTLRMKIHLSNVSIEASHEFSYGEMKSVEEMLGKLARFDLIESDLIFESFSDGSKSIDLKSSDVLIYDIRNDNRTKILLPSPKEGLKTEYLQFEIHYLDTKEKMHLTFLCNQSRILLQFDFLLDTFRFILRAKENDYKKRQMSSYTLESLKNESSDILTKSPVKTPTGDPKMFELKVNVTESQLVVVEDINAPDTRTVILQTTAVLAFRPDHSSEKPVTCSLQSLEIFSCQLNKPDDSALSIVDPVAFLVELKSGNSGLPGPSSSLNKPDLKPVLEVQFQVPVYLRLSYHDVQMFLQIVNKAKEQLSKALDNGNKDDNEEASSSRIRNDPSAKLVRFQNDVESKEKGLSLKDAISLQHAADSSPVTIPKTSKVLPAAIERDPQPPAPSAISGLEIKANFISVTLIDDCGNNEVPLIDLSLNNLMLNHYYDPAWKGCTDCSMDADYYNTRVSAWEPLIEGWRFNTHWFKTQSAGSNKVEKTAVKIDAPERLDINLTNAFIDITNKTANLWRSRFYVDAASNEKKRAPFLPFLLRNKVGCNLKFSTLMKSPAKTAGKTRRKEIHQELTVDANSEVAFAFEGRTKQRHQGTHQLMVHQIVIHIPGKYDIQPITVDKVGRVFRIAYNSQASEVHQEEDSANDIYLIIDINLEGARKVITIKTALTINNNLTTPVEIVGTRHDKHYHLASIDVNESYIVPITLLQCKLYCRPVKGSATYQLSDELLWRDVKTRGEKGILRYCPGEVDPNLVFRFCAIVRCLGFPKAVDWELDELYQPEHMITLTHHILIYNQLPFDLFYNVKGRAMKELIKPGDKAPLQFKESTSTIEIGFSFEGFPHYDTIKIVYEDSKYMIPVRIYDVQNRLLILHAVVMCRSGSIQISVYTPYWLINKTGIPLVFRREEESVEIAGQFEEHEEARSLTPLPFSFLTTNDNYNCQVRMGKNYQHCDGKTPLWSKPFSLEKENDHRTLYVRERRDLPEKGYNIGIMMTWGKGVYSQTKIVSFVPRFQIYNQTSKNIYITQKCMLNDKNLSNHKGTLCPRGAVTIFHWPSCNLDNLLCVRMEDSLLWSGCIKIDCETTFHINMKTNSKHSTYFRAHISFSAGTFRTTFNDAKTFPPPFKIINLSDVALFYWQETKSNEPYGTFIKAKEAKDYALDEPLMPAKLTVSVYQESIHTYDLKQNGKHQAKLYYQNAIFIGLTHTFFDSATSSTVECKCGHVGVKNSDDRLVLDVINDRNIYLSKKAEHKRSQLWRMNANGNLVHFDSTTVKDKFSSNNILVLDVDDSKEGDVYPLILNQLNSNRKKTQTWYFENNTLRCCAAGYAVHPVRVQRDKQLVVLGLKCLIKEDELAMKTCINSYRLRPGSGVLSAYIFSRGPTQVLEITDSQHENSHDSWVMVEPSVATHSSFMCTSLKDSPSTELVVSLASGIGISVINFQPEEVIFVSLRQLNFNLNFNDEQYSVEAEIGKIQIDNQLFGCQAPVAIYASPLKGSHGKKAADLRFEIKIEKDKTFDLLVFKRFCVDMCRLMVILEDRLFLKIIQAVQNLVDDSSTSNKLNSKEATNIFDSHKIDHIETTNQRRLFFEDITINQGDLTVSLIVTGKIDKDLIALKSALGIPLVSFESAVFGFETYTQNNMYDTAEHLIFHLIQFYKSTFISQAAVLLGSLDLLGNPMGLIQDFSSGIEGLLKKGNLGGLFVNVAHGFSDSAAKMTGVIADSLWTASMDNKFLESRDSLRVSRGSSSSTHFSAGLQGLGMGVIGGLTSMVTQPIEGAAKKGFTGFFAGLGKGLVGTVAKPVAGVLDLASGTAAAVRNTTETTAPVPLPVRTKRNCYGPGGVLGKYSKIASDGQDILLKFNEGTTSEKYVGMESVRTSPDRLKALFTNKGVYFVKSGPPCPENIKLHVDYTRLLDSSYYFEERHHIIEIYFCRRQNIGVRKPSVDTRTTIRCDNERIAFKVCEKINYLKSLHLESLYVITDTQEYG